MTFIEPSQNTADFGGQRDSHFHSAGTVKPYIPPLAFQRDIIVTSSNQAMAYVTAEAGVAMMFIGNWEAKKWSGIMEQGGWKTRSSLVPGIQGKTIGIIGYGAVTQAMLPLLRPYRGTRLLIYSNHLTEQEAQEQHLTKVTLEELLIQSDIISLQTGLNDQTYHMLNEKRLRMIKSEALLVNIGRGELLEEEALIRCLQEGRFRAALDVYSIEPLPEESPLRTLSNVTCFPHLGAATPYSWESMGREVLENLKDFLAGKTPRSKVAEKSVITMSIH